MSTAKISPDTLSKFKEQNAEIIKSNIKLNKRISNLEGIIQKLQEENVQLRLNQVIQKNCRNSGKRKQRKSSTSSNNSNSSSVSKTINGNRKKRGSREITGLLSKKLVETVVANSDNNNKSKRLRVNKKMDYTLPSIGKKLRKGDPFTFGN